MNKIITTHIIPIETQFNKIDAPHELHLEAICVFTAIGFFHLFGEVSCSFLEVLFHNQPAVQEQPKPNVA